MAWAGVGGGVALGRLAAPLEALGAGLAARPEDCPLQAAASAATVRSRPSQRMKSTLNRPGPAGGGCSDPPRALTRPARVDIRFGRLLASPGLCLAATCGGHKGG